MKRISLLLLGVLLIPISFMRVEARKFTVNEVSDYFNKDGVVTKVNTESKKLDFYSGDSVLFSLQYTDDYLLYDDPITEVTTDEYQIAVFQAILLPKLVKSMMAMGGIQVESLKPEIYDCTDYDKSGIAIKSLKYNFNETTDGGTFSASGDYINYFKISLDSDTLVTLANTYGVIVDYSKYKDLVTTSFVKIDTFRDKKQVYYKFTLNYTKTDEDDNPQCYMYRSDSLNGTFIKVQTLKTSCIDSNDGSYLFDDDISDGGVYYYKPQVVGSDKFGNIIKVDLSNNTVTDAISGEPIVDKASSKDEGTEDKKPDTEDKKEEPKKDYKNPETGAFLPALPILVLVLVSGVVWSKVKNKFVRL